MQDSRTLWTDRQLSNELESMPIGRCSCIVKWWASYLPFHPSIHQMARTSQPAFFVLFDEKPTKIYWGNEKGACMHGGRSVLLATWRLGSANNHQLIKQPDTSFGGPWGLDLWDGRDFRSNCLKISIAHHQVRGLNACPPQSSVNVYWTCKKTRSVSSRFPTPSPSLEPHTKQLNTIIVDSNFQTPSNRLLNWIDKFLRAFFLVFLRHLISLADLGWPEF